MPNHSICAVLAVLGSALAVAGCSTPEYRAERSLCADRWFAQIPPEYQDRLVLRYEKEEQPDGTQTCTTEHVRDSSNPARVVYTTRRECKPNTKTVTVPRYEVETIDTRKRERDQKIDACTARACLSLYGNAACEP
ncbi:MAG: hypothetical protein GDA40_00860 [Rhodobacteraceae bacterium]|nr:hypothetical protein [Paracoccaceae bacterium]